MYAWVMHESWVEYRRDGDNERLGWIQPVGEGFVAIDLLGRTRTDVTGWVEAEEFLNELGLAYLSEAYELLTENKSWIPVRITSVSAQTIEVKTEDYGAIDVPTTTYTLPFEHLSGLRAKR